MPQIILADKPPFNRIRLEAFWGRFTPTELVAYDVAAQHNPADNAAGNLVGEVKPAADKDQIINDGA